MTSRRKGIILAGGLGTRLHPLTIATSKQLLAVYDKPLIYYSLSTLMLAGIRDIALISSPEALPQFKTLFGDGSDFGINLHYIEQANPNGIAEAILLSEDHIAGHDSALVLGDNIFYGNGLTDLLRQADNRTAGSTIFSYRINNPSAYGIVEIDANGNALSIEEKPDRPRSNLAVTGLYFYDPAVLDIAKNVKPSHRGELEITSVNNTYLEAGNLSVCTMHRGFAWFDAGTIDDLMAASEFVQHIEKRQGLKICCPEEISLNNAWLTSEGLRNIVRSKTSTPYYDYLRDIIGEEREVR